MQRTSQPQKALALLLPLFSRTKQAFALVMTPIQVWPRSKLC